MFRVFLFLICLFASGFTAATETPAMDKIANKEVSKSEWLLADFSDFDFPYVFAYEMKEGSAEVISLNTDENNAGTRWHGEIGAGFTHLMAYGTKSEPLVVAYNIHSGFTKKIRIAKDGKSIELIEEDYWSKGWSSMRYFKYFGDSYFISYNRDTGYTKINLIKPDNETFETIYAHSWKPGRTTVQPISFGNDAYFFLYNSDTGRVVVSQMVRNGKKIGTDGKWWGVWSKESSQFSAFEYAGQVLIARYKQQSKVLQILKFHPEDQTVRKLSEIELDMGADRFTTFSLDKSLYLIEKGEQPTRISKLNDAADRIVQQWYIEEK